MKLIFLLLVAIFSTDAADISDLVEGNRKFSGALYSDAPRYNSDLDVVLSPFCIQTVLALTQSGAKGLTASEIREAASLPSTSEDTEAAIKSALATIQSKISNKVYVETGFSTRQDFVTLATDIYKSSFEDVEFINSVAAAATVNDWAKEQTNSRFANYFAYSEDFTKLSKDLLINTLQVKKSWVNPFQASQTKQEIFYGINNQRYNVQMMTQGPLLYNYFENEELDAKFLEMTLDENSSFTIVLPNTLTGLPKVEKQIDLALTPPAYTQEVIQLSLPRTNVQATYISLTSSLQKLGIQAAWTDADLSGMAGIPGEIAAYNFIHDTFFYLDEAGLEAAAGGLVNVRVPTTKHFNVYMPFLFYIKINGIIAFVGKVTNPVYTIHH